MASDRRRRNEISELIEKSSLGSREARGIRSLTGPAAVAQARLEDLRRRARAGDATARQRLSDLASAPTDGTSDAGSDESVLTYLAYETALDAYERAATPVASEAGANSELTVRKLGTELWTAIGGGDIDVCYQPKVEMATGIVRGAEALVRWYHPRLGRVRPSKLVQVAERTGAIRPLTMWVMRRALAECKGWRDHGWDLGVAVNLSARNLVDRQLPTDVAELLDESGVPATALTLEVTETMVVGESQRSLDVVQSLVELGVKISCDDFGTGYASLARLRRLPINEIKVDRSFVARMADDDTDRAITRSVLALGRGLGLTTVAEGVEDRGGWDILRAFGCDQAQGFLVSRPLAAPLFRDWMARRVGGDKASGSGSVPTNEVAYVDGFAVPGAELV